MDRFPKIAALLLAATFSVQAHSQDAQALRERHAALRAQLTANAFGRPLFLESSEQSGSVRGEIHAVIDAPYATARSALVAPEGWCDILILHLNVKECRPLRTERGVSLRVAIGRKFEQPVEEAYRVEFDYRVRAADADYLQLALQADTGPFGTRAYRLAFEAAPLEDGTTFAHLSYSYGYGTAARLAMQAYLHTLGSGKVGFTVERRGADGAPVYVGGLRGALERNAMRYFLAIGAYLDSLNAPAGERLETRLRRWFADTERYPAQLHELASDEYLEMKRREAARQASPPGAPAR